MNDNALATRCSLLSLRQASRVITAFLDRHLKPAGLTSTQFSILAALQESPGIGMQVLAETLILDRTSLVRALQPLTSKGYINQHKCADHARKLALRLSPLGSSKLEEAFQRWSLAEALVNQSLNLLTPAGVCATLTEVTNTLRSQTAVCPD